MALMTIANRSTMPLGGGPLGRSFRQCELKQIAILAYFLTELYGLIAYA